MYLLIGIPSQVLFVILSQTNAYHAQNAESLALQIKAQHTHNGMVKMIILLNLNILKLFNNS